MKSNYLLWSFNMILLSGLCFGQNAYVTGNLKVKVQPNTLFYFGENFELTSAATDDAVVENAGNVEIVGNYVNNWGGYSGMNFLSTWTSAASYGQVIIHDTSMAGLLAMEKVSIPPASNAWGQFSIPFSYSDADEATHQLFGISYIDGIDRYHASMMVWNNSVEPRFDHLNFMSTINPLDYVILNLFYDDPGLKHAMTSSAIQTYKGAPTNAVYNTGVMNTSMFFPADDWDVWKKKFNGYNERFRTYIEDPIRDPSDVEFGKYIFQYGNPYTSNIYLANIGRNDEAMDDGVNIPNLKGVSRYLTNGWTANSTTSDGGAVSGTGTVKATYDAGTKTWAGDVEALIVQPFEAFNIHLTDNNNASQMEFSDKLKTFGMTGDLNGGAATKMAGNFSSPVMGTEATPVSSGFYQLRIKLFNNDGEFVGNRLNVVASSIVENGLPNEFEAEYFDFGERTGFYLAQENAEGTHVTQSDRKMDINAVNTDFVGKAIPLFFNRVDGDNDTYTVKAELFQGSIFNKLSEGNYDDGNSWFFYDSDNDELLAIDTNFSYQIAPQDIYGSRARYELYWNEGPSDRGSMGTNDQLASSTIVYKDIENFFVKFNVNWNNADVKVYDLTGRNILTYKNVNTKERLQLDLSSRGVYVVKVVSSNGEVYTQKIIK